MYETRIRSRIPTSGMVGIDKQNRFGARARIFLYPLSTNIVYEACLGRAYRTTVASAAAIGKAIRGNSSIIITQLVRCPPDLLANKPQTIIVAFRGMSDSWLLQYNRLFAAVGGAGWRLQAVRQSATQISIKVFSFNDTGAPDTIVTVDPRQPMVIGCTLDGTSGANNATMYVNGIFVGQDTVTPDADATGATDLYAFGSTSADVDYYMGGWFAGCFSPGEMLAYARNQRTIWQALTPAPIFGYLPASTGEIKTVNSLAIASVKTFNGVAKASVKTANGLRP